MIDIKSSGCMSTCIVFETFVENFPVNVFPDLAWNPSDNSITTVLNIERTSRAWDGYVMDHKVLIHVAPVWAFKRGQ